MTTASFQDRVTISVTNGIADVRLNRPDKRNALDNAMFKGIVEAGEWVKSASGVRVVVLSGEGASFCAGLDFSSLSALAGRDSDSNTGDSNVTSTGAGAEASTAIGSLGDGQIAHLGQRTAWVWQEVAVPVIAAVHGHALGGGFQVALGADIRFAHPDTKMSVRESFWGLSPDMTASLFLSRLTRPDVAKELAMTARIISGAEAHALGIVTHLSDDPRAAAFDLAHELLGRSPDAVRGVKALFNRLANADAAEMFALERETITSLIGTPNQAEAVAAGMENRPPVFTDPA